MLQQEPERFRGRHLCRGERDPLIVVAHKHGKQPHEPGFLRGAAPAFLDQRGEPLGEGVVLRARLNNRGKDFG